MKNSLIALLLFPVLSMAQYAPQKAASYSAVGTTGTSGTNSGLSLTNTGITGTGSAPNLSVAGTNVIGTVPAATYSGSTGAVAGANVSGTVANAYQSGTAANALPNPNTTIAANVMPSAVYGVTYCVRSGTGPIYTPASIYSGTGNSVRSPRPFYARGQYWMTMEGWPNTNTNSIWISHSVTGTSGWTAPIQIIIPTGTNGQWNGGIVGNGGEFYDVVNDQLSILVTGGTSQGILYSGPLTVGVYQSPPGSDWTVSSNWTATSNSPILTGSGGSWGGGQGIYQASAFLTSSGIFNVFAGSSGGNPNYSIGLFTGTSLSSGTFTNQTPSAPLFTLSEEPMSFQYEGALCIIADGNSTGSYGFSLHSTWDATGKTGWVSNGLLLAQPSGTSAWDYSFSGPCGACEMADGSKRLLIAYAGGNNVGVGGDPPRSIGIAIAKLSVAPNVAMHSATSVAIVSATLTNPEPIAVLSSTGIAEMVLVGNWAQIWMSGSSGGGSANFLFQASNILQMYRAGTYVCGIDAYSNFNIGTSESMSAGSHIYLDASGNTYIISDGTTITLHGAVTVSGAFSAGSITSTSGTANVLAATGTSSGTLTVTGSNTTISAALTSGTTTENVLAQVGPWAGMVATGSVSTTGTATAAFVVPLGVTEPNSTYQVAVTPTSLVAAAVFYVSSKSATSFTVTYTAALTGAVSFDWMVIP